MITVGVVVLIIGGVALAEALLMINYMASYHCMGMMCGPMLYYPLALPLTLLVVGLILLTLPFTILRNRNVTGATSINSGGASGNVTGVVHVNEVAKLLPSQERVVFEYIVKSGGEVYQYQIMRDLKLSKVKAWRIVRRLEEKGLVEVTKVKGRNVVKLRGGREK